MGYNPDQKDFVYRIWAFEGDRNAEKTQRLVIQHPDAGDLGLSELTSRSIRNWARDEGWQDRAYTDIYAVAPELRFSAQATLALASPEAAEVLRAAINTDCMVDRHILVKGKDGDTYIETVREFDTKLFQIKVNAAQVLLDRTGFSPVGTRETGVLDAPPTRVGDLVAELGDPNLDHQRLGEIERQLRQELGLGTAVIGIGQSHKTQENRGWESS